MNDSNKNKEFESGISKEVKSIGRKSGVYLVGQVLSKVVGFVMIPVYTHYISPTNYGAMEMIEILASCLAVIVAINFGESMARFYYAQKDQNERNMVVSTAYIGMAVLGIPIVLISLLFTPILGNIISDDPIYHYILKIAFISIWFAVICDIGFSYLRMIYKAKLFVTVVLSQLFIALFLNIYLVVFLKMDILGIFYSTLISQGLAGTVLAVGILRNTRLNFSIKYFLEFIKYGLPIVPSRIAMMLGFVSNRFFLRWANAADPTYALAQVGLYSLGNKFGVVVNRFVTAPFNSYWNPRRMEMILSEEPEARRTVARVCTYATLGTVYAALFISAGIESVIEIVADPSYHDAYLVVPFVTLAYIALSLETHFVTGIHYSKQTKWLTYIGILGLGIVLLWNYIFVPRFGLIGAATSNLAGFVVRLLFIYRVSQRLYRIPYELGRIGLILLISFIVYFITQKVSFESPYLTFLARMIIVSPFPFIFLLLRFYTDGERRFAWEFVQKKLLNIK
jgi:O-antigen/teichoic acid export membrane protein